MVVATDEPARPTTGETPPSPATDNETPTGEKKKWGYDLYPERKGEPYKPKWSSILFGMEGTENMDKIKCERNVVSCIKDSPMVKLMMGALKSSGWWVQNAVAVCIFLAGFQSISPILTVPSTSDGTSRARFAMCR